MRTKGTCGMLTAVALVLLLGVHAEAQLAKQGTYSGLYGWTLSSTVHKVEEGHVFTQDVYKFVRCTRAAGLTPTPAGGTIALAPGHAPHGASLQNIPITEGRHAKTYLSKRYRRTASFPPDHSTEEGQAAS